MSGAWRVWPRRVRVPPPQIHDHIDLLFRSDCIRLTDPRRFGAVLWHAAADGPVGNHPLLAGLGIEPFDPGFTGDWLYRLTRARSAAIKHVLLAGDVVVGVGNIYASRACSARINPKLPARLRASATATRCCDHRVLSKRS
jgi:formamidopyrimidine-DNA glycosylase